MAETRDSVSPISPCVISDKHSENKMMISEESKHLENKIMLSEESNESTVSSNLDDAVITSASVTEEMFEIERQLEEENKAEEQRLREEAMKVAEERKENCYKRLQHLLDRSNIYAQFLVSRMEKQQEIAAKKKERKSELKNRGKLKEEQLVINQKHGTRRMQNADEVTTTSSSSRVEKRPLKSPASSKSHKRAKQEEIQLSEFFDEKDLKAQSNKPSEPGDAEDPAAAPDTYSRTINGEKVSDRQPNLFTGGVMRPYQIQALEWLKVLYENGVNGILGDEMGLGKTIECIALIAHLVEMGVAGPFMVVCPLSTLYNWCNEFQRFTPEIPSILYHGSKEERAVLRRRLRRKVAVRNNFVYPVLVTSYTLIMNDRVHLMNFPWIIIIDEGHRIKNWQCRLVRDLKMYQSTNRLLLTGTPLQNNLAELWSLLNFLLPEIFDDLQVFESWFDIRAMTEQRSDEQIIAQEQEKQIISTIHQILTPFLLRRTKADVDLKLPPKKELIVYAPVTQKQRELYSAVADKTITKLLGVVEDTKVLGKRRTQEIDYSIYFDDSKIFENHDDLEQSRYKNYIEGLNKSNGDDVLPNQSVGSGASAPPSVIRLTTRNCLMLLRKICNHPYLVEFPLDPKTQDYLIDDNMVKVCGKLQVLDLMLLELQKRGHKVLIFSQFVTMLDILDYYCELRGFPYCRIHGAVPVEERQRLIDDFNENPSSFIFLISTRAGGLGINLTRADTVIIYDSDWNPQSDLQAQDRCHRFGQTRPVVVYRLVTANTVDQKIVERACAKRKLEKMIIRNGRFSSCDQLKISNIITPEELLQILRETDVSKSMNIEDVISREDLNMLLDRSDMLRLPEKSHSSSEVEELRNPAEVKGVFKVVEQLDSCDFARNIDIS